jgi:long-chain fatty acid transport protein
VLTKERLREIAVVGILAAAPHTARAGGMMLPERGVRALAQAGALVAGADDADALWLDPAGLAHGAGDGKRSFLFDVAYVYQTVDYTRADAAGTAYPLVSNQQPGNAVPTIAASLGIGGRLVIAGGLTEPYIGLHRYDAGGPQRYASFGLDGSTFFVVTLGAAYVVTDRLRVGATIQDTVSHVALRVVASACPNDGTCTPGDAARDAAMSLSQNDYLGVSGSVGAQYDATERVTIGAVVQAPTRIGGQGAFSIAVPNQMVTGDRAGVAFTLPPTIRAAVEVRPTRATRIEAAVDVELWSMHDRIDLAPANVQVGGAPLAAMTIPRGYGTSAALAIGGEAHFGAAMLGAGVGYETSAAPPAYVSVLTVDAPKLLVGLGGGYADAGWQIGGAIGLAQLADVTVAPADAKVPLLQPLAAQPAALAVNAGRYASRYIVAGLRFARRF